MGEGVVDGDRRQLGLGAPPERASARGQHDPAHPRPGAAGVLGAEALVDRAVLAVDRDQLPAPGRSRAPLHHRTRRDQRLLVGEREPLAGTEGRQRDAEAREPDDAIDADVTQRRDVGKGVRAGDDLGAVRYPRSEVSGLAVVGDRDDRRPPALRLLRQLLDRRPRAQCRDGEPLRLALDHVERLHPDRPRRPRNDDGCGHPVRLLTG